MDIAQWLDIYGFDIRQEGRRYSWSHRDAGIDSDAAFSTRSEAILDAQRELMQALVGERIWWCDPDGGGHSAEYTIMGLDGDFLMLDQPDRTGGYFALLATLDECWPSEQMASAQNYAMAA